MLIKGINKRTTIELFEEINFSDNEEILLEIQGVNDFWSALQNFRKRVDLESIDDDAFDNLRDKLSGNVADFENFEQLKLENWFV